MRRSPSASAETYGAEVVLYDRDKEDREAIGAEVLTSAAPPWCGPGRSFRRSQAKSTAGREIAEDMAARGLTPDIVVAPASGGESGLRGLQPL